MERCYMDYGRYGPHGSVAFRVGSGAVRVTTDTVPRPSYSAGARQPKRSKADKQSLLSRGGRSDGRAYGSSRMPLCPYGKPPTRCSSTCSDADCLLASEQAQVLKGLSVHETVPPSGYPEDGTNHDIVIAPEPTIIEEHQSSYSTSAAKTDGTESTIVNTERSLPVHARMISPESWGTGSRLTLIMVIGILISLGLITQWSAPRTSYSSTVHTEDQFMPRRMSITEVVRIEKSTHTDRTPETHETRQPHHSQSMKNTLMFRIMPACLLLMIVAHMFPGAPGGSRRGGRSDPPPWNPDNEATYPFRHWMQDLLAWTIVASDLDASQQCAAIILQLGGPARDLVRHMSFQDISTGGQVAGQQVDPVTFLLSQLAQHFAQLGEEQRLNAMGELMSFHRKPNEGIDALISRYMTLRFRATQGQVGITMNWEAYSWLLLKAVGPNHGQLMMLLHPYQGRWPSTEPEFNTLTMSLRRMGHILENTHGNISQALTRAPRSGFFGETGDPTQGTPTQVYMGSEQPSQASSPGSDPWQQVGADPWSSSGTSPATPQRPPNPLRGGSGTSASYFGEVDSGTDSDTESDEDWEVDYRACGVGPDWTSGQVDAELFWQYTRAKQNWRRHSKKPVRRVRRFLNRKGKGKGRIKGKGKGRYHFLEEMQDPEVEELFFGGAGKGKGKRSSGKGKGRRKNPIDSATGEPMKCHTCGADDHLAARCNNRQGGGNFLTYTPTEAIADSFFGDILSELPNSANQVSFYSVAHAEMLGSASNLIPTPMPSVAEGPAEEGDWQGWQAPLSNRWRESAAADSIWEQQQPVEATVAELLGQIWNAQNEGSTVSANESIPLPGIFTPTIPAPPATQGQGPTGSGPATSAGVASWLELTSTRHSIVEQTIENAMPTEDQGLHSRLAHLDTLSTSSLAGFQHLGQHRRRLLENRTGPPVGRSVAHWPDQQVGIGQVQTAQIREVSGGAPQLIDLSGIQSVQARNTAAITDRREQQRSRLQARLERAQEILQEQPQPVVEEPDDPCPICTEVPTRGARMRLLECGHSLHSLCFDAFIASLQEVDQPESMRVCPICRHPLSMMNTEYIYGVDGNADSQAASEASYISAAEAVQHPVPVDETEDLSAFPWWPAQTGQVFHTATQLPDGRHSMIVDCGAWSNLMGADLAKALALRARQRGHRPTERRIPRMSISGVGNGQQHCDWEIKVPIAVPNASAGEGAFTSLMHNLTTPVVEGGEGKLLPGLLGLQSMERLRAVIDTHNQKMILPGPGDIKYILPPGSMEIPLEKAPSGHLVMVIDAYDAVRVGGSGALPTQRQEFHAEPPQSASSTWHPEASERGPASDSLDKPRMDEILQRDAAARESMAQAMQAYPPELGPIFRLGTSGTSSSSRDSHLPELPPSEEDQASPR